MAGMLSPEQAALLVSGGPRNPRSGIRDRMEEVNALTRNRFNLARFGQASREAAQPAFQPMNLPEAQIPGPMDMAKLGMAQQDFDLRRGMMSERLNMARDAQDQETQRMALALAKFEQGKNEFERTFQAGQDQEARQRAKLQFDITKQQFADDIALHNLTMGQLDELRAQAGEGREAQEAAAKAKARQAVMEHWDTLSPEQQFQAALHQSGLGGGLEVAPRPMSPDMLALLSVMPNSPMGQAAEESRINLPEGESFGSGFMSPTPSIPAAPTPGMPGMPPIPQAPNYPTLGPAPGAVQGPPGFASTGGGAPGGPAVPPAAPAPYQTPGVTEVLTNALQAFQGLGKNRPGSEGQQGLPGQQGPSMGVQQPSMGGGPGQMGMPGPGLGAAEQMGEVSLQDFSPARMAIQGQEPFRPAGPEPMTLETAAASKEGRQFLLRLGERFRALQDEGKAISPARKLQIAEEEFAEFSRAMPPEMVQVFREYIDQLRSPTNAATAGQPGSVSG